MSKKSKTTGVPAPAKRTQVRYKSRAEREAETNRLVLIIAGVLAGIVLVIVAIAFFVDGVIRPNQPVACAGGQCVSAAAFERRVSFERWRMGLALLPIARSQFAEQFLTNPQFGPYAEMYQRLQIPSLLGQQVLNELIDNLVIQQYAAAHDITVGNDEIDNEIYEFFQYQPTPMTATPSRTPTATLTPLVSATPSPSPTPTEEPTITATPTFTPFPTGLPTATPGPTEQFEAYQEDSKTYYEEAARMTGFSQAEIRQVFAEQVLRDKVRKAVLGDPPQEQEQVKVRHILLKTPDDAQEALNALQKGEPFAALARAVSEDPGSRDQGGELGWAGRGAYVPQFEDAVWSAEIGQIIGPVDTSSNGPNYGYHILQVVAREMRPLTESQQADLQAQQFSEWLNAQREEKNAETFGIWIDFVPRTPTLAEMGLPESIR